MVQSPAATDTGFDLTNHCAKGLLGKYSTLLPFRASREPFVVRGKLDEHPFEFIYVCGNTGRWAKNVHIALQAAPGQVGQERAPAVHFEDENIDVLVVGMERVEIHPVDVDLPARFDRHFTTCRNRQFGFEYFDGTAQLAKLPAADRKLF